MKLTAFKSLDLSDPLGVFNASLYKGPSSLQFIKKTRTGIELVLPFGSDSSSRRLSQRITGTIKYNSSGIFWEGSAITAVQDFDLQAPSGKPQPRWAASQFTLSGKDILLFREAYESWYKTPESWENYQKALAQTRDLIEKTLFRGKDSITGSDEIDVLAGGDGDDDITGRGSSDTLTGGRGIDRFIYLSTADSAPSLNTIDTITDFTTGKRGDRIDLKAIRSSTDKPLNFIGKSEFNGLAGEVRYGMEKLEIDSNGDRLADMIVNLPKTTNLTLSSLILQSSSA